MLSHENTASQQEPVHSCCCSTAKKEAPKAVSDVDRQPASGVNTHEQLSGLTYWRRVLLRIWQGDQGRASRRSS
jgi:hypothetical protein